MHKAQESLEKTKHFQPFIVLLNDTGKIEIFENEVKDLTQSYTLLEETLKERMNSRDVDVMVLVVDTLIPDRSVKYFQRRLYFVSKSSLSPLSALYLENRLKYPHEFSL